MPRGGKSTDLFDFSDKPYNLILAHAQMHRAILVSRKAVSFGITWDRVVGSCLSQRRLLQVLLSWIRFNLHVFPQMNGRVPIVRVFFVTLMS